MGNMFLDRVGENDYFFLFSFSIGFEDSFKSFNKMFWVMVVLLIKIKFIWVIEIFRYNFNNIILGLNICKYISFDLKKFTYFFLDVVEIL